MSVMVTCVKYYVTFLDQGLAERFVPMNEFDEIIWRLLRGEGAMVEASRFLIYSRAYFTTPSGAPQLRLVQVSQRSAGDFKRC